MAAANLEKKVENKEGKRKKIGGYRASTMGRRQNEYSGLLSYRDSAFGVNTKQAPLVPVCAMCGREGWVGEARLL